MVDDIVRHLRVTLALAELPVTQRDRARRELRRVLADMATAKADEIAAELLGGPRRAPHWRASWAALLAKEARRRSAVGDPASGVFSAASDVAAA